MLKRVLAGHEITVGAHYDGVICGGVVASPDEEMPVKLSNDRDEAALEREGTVFCGLRRGPIWGTKLEQDLDAPASSPIFSGEKATFLGGQRRVLDLPGRRRTTGAEPGRGDERDRPACCRLAGGEFVA